MVKFQSLVTTALMFMFLMGIGTMLGGCDVNTSSDIDIDTNDFVYVKDGRTGICYSIIASRRTASFSTSGLGVTAVPCDKVVKFLIR